MGAVLLGAPLLWTVLPLPWAAGGGAPAAVLLAAVLVMAATIAVTIGGLGPRRRSRSGARRWRVTGTAGRTGVDRQARSEPDSGPRWG
jgi:hypothetical protein